MSLKKLRAAVESQQEARRDPRVKDVPGTEGLIEVGGAILTAFVGLAAWLSGGFIPALALWAGSAVLIHIHNDEKKVYAYQDMQKIADGLGALVTAMVAVCAVPLPKGDDSDEAYVRKLNDIISRTPFGISVSEHGVVDHDSPFERKKGTLEQLGYRDDSLRKIAESARTGATAFLAKKSHLTSVIEHAEKLPDPDGAIATMIDVMYVLEERFHHYSAEINGQCRILAKSYAKKKDAKPATESYDNAVPGTEGFLSTLKSVGAKLKQAISGAPKHEASGAEFESLMKSMMNTAKLYDGYMSSGGEHPIAAGFVEKGFSMDKADKQFNAASFIEFTPKGLSAELTSLATLPGLLDKCYHLPLATTAEGVAEYKSKLAALLKPFLTQWGQAITEEGKLKATGEQAFQRIADLPSSVDHRSMIAAGWTAQALQATTNQLTKLRLVPVVSAYHAAMRGLDAQRLKGDPEAQKAGAQCLTALHRLAGQLVFHPYTTTITDTFERMSYIEYYGSDRAED